MLESMLLLLALPAPALASGGDARMWEKQSFTRETRPPRHSARRDGAEPRAGRPEFRGMLAQAAYSVSPRHWNEEIWSAR